MGVIARQSIKGTIVTYIGALIGGLTTFFVLTRYLTTEEIGLSRVLIDAAVIFVGLAQLGTSSSIIRFYPHFKDNDTNDHGFFFWTLVAPFFGFLIFALIYWALHIPISNYFSENSQLFVDYYYFVLPIAFFMLYQQIFETNANVLMRIVVPRTVREVVVRLLILVDYMLYAYRIISLDGMVVGFCLVYAAAALINLIYLLSLKHISIKPDFKYIKKPLVKEYCFYTFFLLLTALAGTLAPTLSSFFIAANIGLDQTGIFAIAANIAVCVYMPYRAVGAIAQPEISQAMKDGDMLRIGQLTKQVSTNQMLVGMLVLCLFWINIDLIFEILPNGQTFAVAKYVVLVLSCSQLILSSFSISLPVINFSKHYYFSLVYSFVLTAAIIVFNNLLVPHVGMLGSAFANLISYSIYVACLIITALAITKTHPFSKAQLKIMAVFIGILVADFAWRQWCLPLAENTLSLTSVWIHLLDGIVKSCAIFGISIIIIYRWNISPWINDLLCRLIPFKK